MAWQISKNNLEKYNRWKQTRAAQGLTRSRFAGYEIIVHHSPPRTAASSFTNYSKKSRKTKHSFQLSRFQMSKKNKNHSSCCQTEITSQSGSPVSNLFSHKPAALAIASKAPHHHPSRPTLTLRHSFEIHATMADPSASVSPQLLHHLHALCVMKYPLYQSLQPELLVDMLLKTPVVVQQYPFAWSMIEPPPPGSLMLSWHPPAMGTSCASDGYVWADPENVHTVDVKGYVCSPVLL